MNEISDFMEADHSRLNTIFTNFRKIRDQNLEKSKVLFSEFSSDLRRHILWEEEIIFVLIGDKVKIKKGTSAGKTLSMLSMQHTQIIEFLDQINNSLRQGKIEIEFETWLLEILSQHNDLEESIVYPLIDEVLNENEKEVVFQKMKNIKIL